MDRKGVTFHEVMYCSCWNCLKQTLNQDRRIIMMIPDTDKIYPRSGDDQTIYLKNVIKSPNIEVGDFTIYNDFVHDPRGFQQNNVLYHYPINKDKLFIGKFCSIACGAKFLMNCANHTLSSLSSYTFPLFGEEWEHGITPDQSWDNRGDIVIGNDVWIGFDAVVMAGVTIGNGSIIGTRAVVTKDVPPYTIVGGTPAKSIRRRFSQDDIDFLQEIKWWDWSAEKISAAIPYIQSGDINGLKDL